MCSLQISLILILTLTDYGYSHRLDGGIEQLHIGVGSSRPSTASAFENSLKTRATFGEPCNSTIHCNSRAYLTCTNSACECIKSSVMTFSSTAHKCMVLSGEQCRVKAIGPKMENSYGPIWAEQYDCIEHASCNSDGFCACHQDFFENPARLCVQKRSFGEVCSRDAHCRPGKGLTCSDKKCSCDMTRATFNPVADQCVNRVGIRVEFSVAETSLCVPNAFMDRISSQIGECKCYAGFTPSESGLCQVKIGMACSVDTAPCEERWACVDGTCKCPYPDHQFYSRRLDKCVALVRGPCDLQKQNLTGEFPCVSNAECKSDNGFSECLCKDGFIESVGRRCRASYGQPCKALRSDENDLEQSQFLYGTTSTTSSTYRPYRQNMYQSQQQQNMHQSQQQQTMYIGDRYYTSPPSTPKPRRVLYDTNACDPIAKLTCKEGVCSCPEVYEYDIGVSKCVGLVGAKCEPGKDLCIKDAECTKYRDPSLKDGLCTCSSGMKATGERRCGAIKSEGQSDTTTAPAA